MKYFYLFCSTLLTICSLCFVSLTHSSVSSNMAVGTGIASYYSDVFHGKKTACGEVYDKHKLTAAHRTLPIGTKIKITRLDNAKSVVVRINDRGPWSKNRILDMSRAAAEKIGLTRAGKAQVKFEVIDNSNGVSLTEENIDELFAIADGEAF